MSELSCHPYNLNDILGMKPGAILGGFVRVDNSGMQLAPRWSLPDGSASRKEVPFGPILEHKVKWRQKLREHSEMIGESRLYKVPKDGLGTSKFQFESSFLVRFQVGLPVGIYLGHIIRYNNVSLVNVLTSDGYDVWI